MIHIFRLGYVGFSVRDMEAMMHYYSQVMGFTLIERANDGSAYFSGSTDHHNIVLTPSDTPGLHRFGLQFSPEVSMKEAAAALREIGIQTQLKTDPEPGVPELLEFTDPDGYLVQLYSRMSMAAPGFKQTGIAPNKIGHLAIRVESAQRSVEFYQRLGFINTDWIEDFFGFTTCNSDHHVLNFAQSDHKGLHHLAFELRDYSHQTRSMDELGKHRIPILWGPSRHGAGHNIATYHYDPEQNMIELFTDADRYIKELDCFEPRPWHRDCPQKPKVWNADECISQWGTAFEKALV
ncbi:VOC family protein [Brevibacillus sp. TJ4]|uniref:VOC family protein n=1 Tax=Brevibacillus sp. TJ4 TaxID=3234853 RepID=UPI0037D6CACD